MSRKPLVIVEGMRMEFEGQELLLLKMPIPAPLYKTEAEFPVLDIIEGLQKKQIPVVSLYPTLSGELIVAAPDEWVQKLRSKTIPASELTKIPIYESDLE